MRSLTIPLAATTRPTVLDALLNNTAGSNNTATGADALASNTTSGNHNTANGL